MDKELQVCQHKQPAVTVIVLAGEMAVRDAGLGQHLVYEQTAANSSITPAKYK